MVSAKSCRVLLVDDSKHIAQIVQSHLDDPAIDLVISSSGRDGIETFRQSTFDIVLMDLHMPEMDGYETARSIRFWECRHNRWPTPIVALTADSTKAALAEAYGAGCTHYLVKPVNRNILLQVVHQVFSSSYGGSERA